MNSLVGKECEVVFDMHSSEWPIEGYPAHVVVDAVDMPMVKMHSIHVGRPVWVNTKLIRTILERQ